MYNIHDTRHPRHGPSDESIGGDGTIILVQGNTQNRGILGSLGGQRLTAHGNNPDTPFFATDACDLIGIHG